MKKTIKIERHYWEDFVESTVCDLCMREFRDNHWGGSIYPFEEIVTSLEIKRIARDTVETNVYSTRADICPECFENKVIPKLTGIGVSFYKEEITT